MKITILICFLALNVFGQYKLSDKELIQQTASKKINPNLVEKYLSSNDPDSIHAILLSISNTKDTSYYSQVIALDFSGFYHPLLFALGQLGSHAKSTEYIHDKLDDDRLPFTVRQKLLSTYGQVSDSTAGIELLDKYKFEPGMGYAIANYFLRGIDLPNSRMFLHNALMQNETTDQFEVLYALYRITPDSISYKKITEMLSSDDNEISAVVKSYALGCLRKLRMYPDNEFGLSLLDHNDWKIRAEAARTIIYNRFSSTEKINKYFNLLSDANPNVSRTAATSIRDIQFVGKEQLGYVKKSIQNALDNNDLTENTRGELFVSLCSLFPDMTPEFIDDYEGEVVSEFIYSSLYFYNSNPAWKFEFLKDRIPDATEPELLHMVPPLLALHSNFVEDEEYSKVIITLLRSNYPSTVSLIADGIDSLFIQRNASILQQVALEKSFEHFNDPNFIESVFSLVNLSKKISNDFEQSILDIIRSSKLFSVRSFAADRLGIKANEGKVIPDLDKMIEMAFEYSSALVKTSKGSFRIELMPHVAPVSVGNFCLLASKRYFDDVVYHRVVPNFVIQTGDPSGTGWGGPGYEIVSEFSTTEFNRGFVGMASAGPNTEGSQWFVMHNNYPHLNGRYTVFGEVVDGMEIVDLIDQDDKIISIELERVK